jgi:acyl-CoA reductase-like NAD-dependent aldehyde dehydrogenase
VLGPYASCSHTALGMPRRWRAGPLLAVAASPKSEGLELGAFAGTVAITDRGAAARCSTDYCRVVGYAMRVLQVREVEQKLLSHAYASQLAGNQALDFMKQDGLTEIEESVQANEVERRLNDMLLQDEADGKLCISRAPVLVTCVSNFSNFLDLFRKTIRHLELGVPCVVLSRSNTSQHCYRWFQLLNALLHEAGFPSHMLSFASCSVEQQRRLFAALPSSPVHFTGSREVARMIKQLAPRTLSSTGGPNTMVLMGMTPQTAEAVRMSAGIENSGQCTALRHVVASSEHVSEASVQEALAAVPVSDSFSHCLDKGERHSRVATL